MKWISSRPAPCMMFLLFATACTGIESDDGGFSENDGGSLEDAGGARCSDECNGVEGCVEISGYRWSDVEECFEEAFAGCGVPVSEPDVVPPIVDPEGNCWGPNWKNHPEGWQVADEDSPCRDLSGYCE